MGSCDLSFVGAASQTWRTLVVVASQLIIDIFGCVPIMEFAGHGVEVVLDDHESFGVGVGGLCCGVVARSSTATSWCVQRSSVFLAALMGVVSAAVLVLVIVDLVRYRVKHGAMPPKPTWGKHNRWTVPLLFAVCVYSIVAAF